MNKIFGVLILIMFSGSNIFAQSNKNFVDTNSKSNQSVRVNNEWSKKINIYNKTKNKYFRTIVSENPIEFLSNYLVENKFCSMNNFNNKVKDYVINNGSDLMYSLEGKLVINHIGNLGLQINNFIKQQITSNLVLFNFGDMVYDLKKAALVNLKLPRQDFNFKPNNEAYFNNNIFFPYFRLSVSNILYNCDENSRTGNFSRSISKNNEDNLSNSDLIYSIKDHSLKVLENEMKDWSCSYNINTSNSNLNFIFKNKIYKISNLETINPRINFKIDSLINQFRKHYVSFNDSNILIYTENDLNIINLFDSTKFRTIKSIYFDRIAEINFIEVDKLSRYVYLSYNLPYYYNNSHHPREVMVIDLNIDKVVYLGPDISIDYTCDKLGYIMTQASYFTIKDSFISVLKPINANNEKYGLYWDFLNAKIVENNNSNYKTYAAEPAIEKQYCKRYLLNMNPLFNQHFEELMLNYEKEFDKNNNNFFSDSLTIKNQKNRYLDSLLFCSYSWSLNTSKYDQDYYYSSQEVSDSSLVYYERNTIDTLSDNFEGQIQIDSENKIKCNLMTPISFKLASLKKNNFNSISEFVFLLKSNYLDSEIVKILNCYRIKEQVLNLSDSRTLKNYIIVKDSVGYYLYYKVNTKDPILAKSFNDSMKNNTIELYFKHYYNLESNSNCFECTLLNNLSNSEKVDSSNYIVKYCKSFSPLTKFKSSFGLDYDEMPPAEIILMANMIDFKDINLNEIEMYLFDSNLEENFINNK